MRIWARVIIMGRVPQSSIIVVGNEILRGFTVDTNSNWLASRLFQCGFPVRLITTVGDVDDDIERSYLSGERADVVRELHYRLAPESMFHDVMQTLEAEYPDVSLGSYPQTETRELILRASGPNPERVDAVIAAIRERITQYQPVA